MMVPIHSKNSITRNILFYYLALIPLLIFGLYKNGIMLYQKELISGIEIFKPLFIPLIGLVIGVIIELIFNIGKNNKLSNSFIPLYGLIIGMTMPININYIVYSITMIVCLIMVKMLEKININYISLSRVIILIVIIVLNISYANIYETSTILNYSNSDIFLGFNTGGIATTNILLIIVGYGMLCFVNGYKKEIPIYYLITYLVGSIIYGIVRNDVNAFFEIILNSTALFGIVFIATDSKSSPYKRNNRIIYGLVLGIITILLSIIYSKIEAVFISILVANLIFLFLKRLK